LVLRVVTVGNVALKPLSEIDEIPNLAMKIGDFPDPLGALMKRESGRAPDGVDR
jgi:hypothetical protein